MGKVLCPATLAAHQAAVFLEYAAQRMRDKRSAAFPAGLVVVYPACFALLLYQQVCERQLAIGFTRCLLCVRP